MRVLHLSTCDRTGGAAHAAWSLVEALRSQGTDARMLVRDKASAAAHVIQESQADKREKSREHAASLVQRKLINPDRAAISNTWFSLSALGFDLSDHPEAAAADILHLHWVSGFITPGAVRRLQDTRKPVFWTLHDQRPFTGGCHFSAGCNRFERDCRPCAQLSRDAWSIPGLQLDEARRVIDPSRLTLIGPSRWMSQCARRSALFGKARIETIPNSIDISAFKPAPGNTREKLGLAADEIFLLTGVDHSGEIRKGLHLLSDALAIALPRLTNRKVRVVAFGASEPPPGFNYPCQWVGRIDSTAELASLYSASDAFLLSSIEDNLPNTMIEALCCGTPVIGFNIGGVPDGVEPGRNGLLAREISVAAYSEAITEAIRAISEGSWPTRETISAEASRKFSRQAQAQAHLRLYEEALSGGRQKPGPTRLLSPGEIETAAFTTEFDQMVRQANKERWKHRWLRLSRKLSLGLAGKQGDE